MHLVRAIRIGHRSAKEDVQYEHANDPCRAEFHREQLAVSRKNLQKDRVFQDLNSLN